MKLATKDILTTKMETIKKNVNKNGNENREEENGR